MSERKGHWMQTASGRQYWPIDPRAEDVDINDIAHALGMICRYGGHCLDFYSVAEHSVHVSRLVPPEHALVALLHDAAEAYCCDIPRPLKIDLPGYKEIEELNWWAICAKFDLDIKLPPCVHDADVAMLFAERTALMAPTLSPLEGWAMGLKTSIDASKIRIFGYMPGRATKLFLDRFDELAMEAAHG